MRRNFALIVVYVLLFTGCAMFGKPEPDTDLLRRAEKASAKISEYTQAADPVGDDVVVGTDVSDTTMAPSGTTKKFRMRDLPVSDPAAAALALKQDAVAAATNQEITDGTETAPRLMSPAQAKLSAETHGATGDGEDAFVYIAWAADIEGNGFTLTFNPNLDYVAFLSTSTEIASPQQSDFEGLWKYLRGPAGSGFDDCVPLDNDCGWFIPRNSGTPTWTPPAGNDGRAFGPDGREWRYNWTSAQWELVPAAQYVTGTPYSDDPCSPGQYANDATYAYTCIQDGTWRRIAHSTWSAPSPTFPTLTSATIPVSGTTISLAFSEAVTQGAGYSDADLDLDCLGAGQNIALTSTSGNGTATHVYTLATTVSDGDACNLDFSGDANSLEDAGGDDLQAIVSGAVLNQSGQGGSACVGGVVFDWPMTGDFANGSNIAQSGGCSVGDATVTLESAASGEIAPQNAGGFALYIPSGYDDANFAIVNRDLFNESSGTVIFKVLFTAWTDSVSLIAVFGENGTNEFRINTTGGNDLRAIYEGSNGGQIVSTVAANLELNTWYTIKADYRSDNLDPNLRITANGVVGSNNTNLPAWNVAPSIMYLGAFGVGASDGIYIKEVRFYNVWQN